jgi:hypothetical protein
LLIFVYWRLLKAHGNAGNFAGNELEVIRMAEKRLTTRRCDTAKAKDKVYRLTDGGGLSLRVMPSGAKYWQYRYRHGGRETILQLGSYPAISLERARAEHARHREVLRHGRDPVTARRVERALVRKAAGETFSAVADEWLEYHRPAWSGVHHERNEGLLRRVLRPVLGQLPLREIDATAVLSALKAAENDGILESARRARSIARSGAATSASPPTRPSSASSAAARARRGRASRAPGSRRRW